MLKTALAIATVLLVACPVAQAIPTLQLYVPGSTYDLETESWTTAGNPFALQVLGASDPIVHLTDVTLDIGVPQALWVPGGTVTVTGPGYPAGTTVSLFDWGIPARQQPHGVYPTYYYSLALPDMNLAAGTDVIHNYNPGEDDSTARGVILEYTISYSMFGGLHLDASADGTKANGKTASLFAPYSHDADSRLFIPEPPGLVLAGLVALLAVRRRRSRPMQTVEVRPQ